MHLDGVFRNNKKWGSLVPIHLQSITGSEQASCWGCYRRILLAATINLNNNVRSRNCTPFQKIIHSVIHVLIYCYHYHLSLLLLLLSSLRLWRRWEVKTGGVLGVLINIIFWKVIALIKSLFYQDEWPGHLQLSQPAKDVSLRSLSLRF
jgi:hypothetical protein